MGFNPPIARTNSSTECENIAIQATTAGLQKRMLRRKSLWTTELCILRSRTSRAPSRSTPCLILDCIIRLFYFCRFEGDLLIKDLFRLSSTLGTIWHGMTIQFYLTVVFHQKFFGLAAMPFLCNGIWLFHCNLPRVLPGLILKYASTILLLQLG